VFKMSLLVMRTFDPANLGLNALRGDLSLQSLHVRKLSTFPVSVTALGVGTLEQLKSSEAISNELHRLR